MSVMEKSRAVQLIELRHGGRPIEELLAERLNRGERHRQIAAEWGVAEITISKWKKQFGLARQWKAVNAGGL